MAILVNKGVKHKMTKRQEMFNIVIYIVIDINKRYSIKVIQVYASTNASEHSDIEQVYKDITASKTREKAKFVILMAFFFPFLG